MSIKKSKVIVLTTGGTIEKTYSEIDGSLMNRQSALEEQVLPLLRLPATEVEVVEVMAKDSLDMTDSDRQLILDRVQAQSHQGFPILILHGTDTMTLTGRYLCQNIKAPTVPVVLTGAMRPAALLNSDALQNFIEALMACQLLGPGVYIAFHNQVLKADQCFKDRDQKTFFPEGPDSDQRNLWKS